MIVGLRMSAKCITVLLIEDNPGDARLIREMLLEDNNIAFELIHADQLSNGLEYLKGADIDIILLDLGLPDSQGIDTLHAILSRVHHIPIIIQTGLSDGELAVRAVKTGAQDYLIKGQITSPLLSRSICYAIERKKMEESLRITEERFRNLVETVSDIIWEVNEQFIYTYVSPQLVELLGYDVREVITVKSIFDLTLPEVRPGFSEMVDSFAQQRKAFNGIEVKKRHKDGSIMIFEVNGVPFFDSEGTYLGYRGIDHDISVRKELESELRRLAIMDELTGLYNRRGFHELAEQQMRLSNRQQKEMILFFIDVDGMKWINDCFGHQEGDAVLMETANILKETFRESDILARMGGDEFAILAVETSNENYETMIKRLENNLRRYNEHAEKDYPLSLSLGIARNDTESPFSIGDLIEQADQLMYVQKRNKNKLSHRAQ